MADNANLNAAQEAYAAFGRGDIPAVLAAMSDDIEWVMLGPSDLPWAGTFRGKQAVGEWFQRLGENLEFRVFQPKEWIAQGDKVAVLLRGEATYRKTGKPIDQDEVHWMTFRDGKMVRFQAFEDTAQGVAAVRG